jgi:hypothetical protein
MNVLYGLPVNVGASYAQTEVTSLVDDDPHTPHSDGRVTGSISTLSGIMGTAADIAGTALMGPAGGTAAGSVARNATIYAGQTHLENWLYRNQRRYQVVR